MHAIVVMISLVVVSGGYYLMSCINDVPTLRGDNYTEWRIKVALAFVCVEVDSVVDTPQPTRASQR
jgi:hypothetical protein